MNILQVNKNMLDNAKYYVEFFDMREFDKLRLDFSMNAYWFTFLSTTPKFSVPLANDGINQLIKYNTLWFRNQYVEDSAIITLDNSDEYNLMNFITQGISPKDVDLDDLEYLGATLKATYIDLFGATQSTNLITGRVSLNAFNNTVFRINIKSFCNILKGSDFATNVIKYPNGSSFNFISLQQAFENIFNVPYNFIDETDEIDDNSYPVTPFILNQSTYVTNDNKDIVLTDPIRFEGKQIYAEDTVKNTDKYIHAQFSYDLSNPSCNVSLTEYNEAGDEIAFTNTNTASWNVWGNKLDADAFWTGVNQTKQDAHTHYNRFFRPFAVVIAGIEEADDVALGLRENFRVIRNLKTSFEPSTFENDSYYYDPLVNQQHWSQEKVSFGNYQPQPDDVLIYFEVTGDVRFYSSITEAPSQTVLFENTADIYVYNATKDIVYFNHIANQVQTFPMPKQWLDMQQYINTTEIVYSGRLGYDSNNNSEEVFLSNKKPFLNIADTIALATTKSFKNNQDENGEGGNFTGEKQYSYFNLAGNNINTEAGALVVSNILDDITTNTKPKTIRLSEDGKKIFFLRSLRSEFIDFPSGQNADLVDYKDYNSVNQFPRTLKYCEKQLYLFEEFFGYSYNKKEYNNVTYLSWSSIEDMSFPFFTEISANRSTNTMALQNIRIYDATGALTDFSSSTVRNSTNPVNFGTKRTIDPGFGNGTASINMHPYNLDVYCCFENIIYKNLETYKTYDSSWSVLDYNHELNRAIIQTVTDVIYYDTLNDLVVESKAQVGFTYLLSMNRDRFIFSNPFDGKSNELFRIGSVINEPVRLLSFEGNRLQSSMALANTFFKNMNYDNNGVLRIGFTENKNNIRIGDDKNLTVSMDSFKYDVIEWSKKQLSEVTFTNTDNDENSNQEEDDSNLSTNISITMSSPKDINMDIKITRTTTDTILWEVSNDFGSESGSFTETSFEYFSFSLTGVFAGIIIDVNLYNTSLNIGDSFAGSIKKRELIDTSSLDKIKNLNKVFPFVKDNTLSLNPEFLYKLSSDAYKTEIDNFFIVDSTIKKMVTYTITVPVLLLFDTSFQPINIGDIMQFNSDIVDTDGYKDCYIEKMSYNFKESKTTLNLITFI